MIEPSKIADQVRMCAACPKMCRHVCPTFFAWHSDAPTPHGRALLIHQENTGTRQIDGRGVEILYQCLQCSHCLTWCQPEVDIAQIIEQTRERIVKEERYPVALKGLRDNVLHNHNPFGEAHEQRTDWLHPLVEHDGPSIIYFTGCTASYREQDIAISTVKLLEELGYSVVVSKEEECCGSPLLRTGFVTDAMKKAQNNVDLLNSLDGELIVVTCPGCYRALTKDYLAHGLELNKPVKHVSEILSDHLERLPHKTIDARVTYHDPCHLGRHMGIYDAPREVIQRLVGDQFVEMERSRENAMCCGNGAGLRTLFPEKARTIGSERIKHAEDVGADYLVTACPFCKNMLASQGKDRVKVVDLPELVKIAQRGIDLA